MNAQPAFHKMFGVGLLVGPVKDKEARVIRGNGLQCGGRFCRVERTSVRQGKDLRARAMVIAKGLNLVRGNEQNRIPRTLDALNIAGNPAIIVAEIRRVEIEVLE